MSESDITMMNTEIPLATLERKVAQAVAAALDIKPEQVTPSSSLHGDLGAESLDFLDIAFSLEREFKVHFPRQDLLERAAKYFGEDSLVEHGVVTEVGLQMLRSAMPEVDPSRVKPGLRAVDVPDLFTVRTFVRVLDRLLAAKQSLPRQCADCGKELSESSALPELVCTSCDKTFPFPSGDDVLYEDLVRMSQEAGFER
jgi:acyl carrier protein